MALLKIQRPYEPVVNAGIVQDSKKGGFGYATENYERNGDRNLVVGIKAIRQQDIWLDVGRNRIRGVMWTKDGVRIDPEYIVDGRSYYSNDTDEAAIKVLSEIHARRQKEAEGKIRYEELASLNGISIGFTFEESDNTPPADNLKT